MRKKYFVLFGSILTAAAILFTGCSKENNSTGEEPTPTADVGLTPTISPVKEYRFEYNGVTIGIDMEAAPILEALGEPNSYFEAPSCASIGMDKMYTYGSFEIDTSERDGKDYISAILLKDDMIATPEGISLFMTKEDVVAVYGESYAEESGMLVYQEDGVKLKFLIMDGEITFIEYATTALDAQ